MADTATIDLKVDIFDRFKGEIVFTDVLIREKADILHDEVDTFHEDCFNKIKNYNIQKKAYLQFQEKFNPEQAYKYALILDEFYSDDCFEEDYETPNQKFSDFILLVKTEEIDYNTYEAEEYDDSDDQYERMRDMELC